jgi:heme-degrading monooxygenase HmoA
LITEHATLTILPGREQEFERLFTDQVGDVFARAPGFVSIELHRSVERPSTFVMRVGWESLEAHVNDFRESALFTEWRALAGPFFAEPPSVEHFEQV